MRKFLLTIGLLVPVSLMAQTGGVGIGTASPDNNAILELKSNNKTLLLPRLGSSVLNNLAGKEGMIAYDNDMHCFAGYIGTSGIPVTSNTTPLGAVALDTSMYVTQTYTAPGTFMLQDVGLSVYAPASATTFTLKIYSGTGITGTLLGTRSITIPPNNGGLRYLDFTSSNIQFVTGSIYTLQVTSNINASVILHTSDNYNGGSMGMDATNNYTFYDLLFDIRSLGTGRWATLASDVTLATELSAYAHKDTLSGYVNTTTNQSIAGIKTFSGNLIASSKIGIGVAVPNAPLQLANTIANRKVVLYETANNDHQFLGFGVNGGALRYQTANGNDDHVFYSGSTDTSSKELLRIKGNGYIGIGTSSPARRIEVADNSDVSLYIRSSAADMNGMITLNATSRPTNSNVDEFMSFRLSGISVGNIISNGASGVTYNTTSDLRLKEHITTTKYGLEDLMKIGVMDYNMKGIPEVPCTGFIAQDLNAIYPQAVTPGGEDAREKPWVVDYGRITPLLVKAIQDQQQQIEMLEAKVATLETQSKQIAALATLVEQLQQQANTSAQPKDRKVARRKHSRTTFVNILSQ